MSVKKKNQIDLLSRFLILAVVFVGLPLHVPLRSCRLIISRR